jgi:hypothetical protein
LGLGNYLSLFGIMKKYLTSIDYKEINTKRAEIGIKKKMGVNQRKTNKHKVKNESNENQNGSQKIYRYSKPFKSYKGQLLAPSDFRLIENTDECLNFFRDLRSQDYISIVRNSKLISISLKEVESLDYAAISVLTAISDDLKHKRVSLQGDFPDNDICKQFFVESGFLNHMVDDHNHKFPKANKSDLIFFEKGSGLLSNDENIKITDLVKNISKHLTGEHNYCLPVKTIILEICGNSIEWAGTTSQQWLIGAMYDDDRIILTMTDVGKGILETLHRKFPRIIGDLITFKSHHDILMGAFDKKYGSTTKEVNRNKGLPSIKYNFEIGTIKSLKVLTNNVILHFDINNKSRTFEKGSARFRGTFYQWEMNNECVSKLKDL